MQSASRGAASQLPEGHPQEPDPPAWGRAGEPLAMLLPTKDLPSSPAALDRQSSWGSFGGAGSPGAGGAGPPTDAWEVQRGAPEGSIGGANLVEGSGTQSVGTMELDVMEWPPGVPRAAGLPGAGGAGLHDDAWPMDGRVRGASWEEAGLPQHAWESGMGMLGNGHVEPVASFMLTHQDDGPDFAQAPAAAGGAWGSAEDRGAEALAPEDGGAAADAGSGQRNAAAPPRAESNGAVAVGGDAATGRHPSQDSHQGSGLQGREAQHWRLPAHGLRRG